MNGKREGVKLQQHSSVSEAVNVRRNGKVSKGGSAASGLQGRMGWSEWYLSEDLREGRLLGHRYGLENTPQGKGMPDAKSLLS